MKQYQTGTQRYITADEHLKWEGTPENWAFTIRISKGKLRLPWNNRSEKMLSLFLPVVDEFSVIFVMMVWSLLVCSSSLGEKTKPDTESGQQKSLGSLGRRLSGVLSSKTVSRCDRLSLNICKSLMNIFDKSLIYRLTLTTRRTAV